MAYNLESLITILQRILDPQQTHWILDHNTPQLQSLLDKATSLNHILEKSAGLNIESLESQIRDAAHQAEDTIESHMADQILSRPGCAKYNFSTPDLQQVMQKLDSAMEQVMKLMDGKKVSTGSASTGTGASLSPDPSSRSVVVGIHEDLLKLKERLTENEKKLRIVPIVGMGGIGKTTLARHLYNDPLIISHFTTCGWITISQDYSVRAIMLGLLGCAIENLTDELVEKKDDELGHILYQRLFERRYLIVLDDMWGTKCWDEIRRFFPDTNNGSRILITTRESNVAKHADSQSSHHLVQLLNEFDSWNLLHQNVFGNKDFPDTLQGIGRKIASDCGGLPLAINVIGGLLSKSEKSKHVWENISNDVRAAIAGADKQSSDILSLSYNYLPYCLRPCFLYMGAFPEDHEIRASKLIHMWVSEGFLKSSGDKSLEEEAEDYLNALVQRNLVLVTKNKSNGKVKSVGMHDLLRDLCMRKAYDEKFLHVKNWRVQNVSDVTLRRVSAHTSYRIRDMYHSAEFMSLARTFLCTGSMSRAILSPIIFALRLLRVLDIFDMRFQKFPEEVLELVHLRYLALSCFSRLPEDISRLWNLQILIARLDGYCVSFKIWEMPELRHLKLKNGGYLWFPGGYNKKFVLDKVQTISAVDLNVVVFRGLLEIVPNIKNLGIICCSCSSEVDLRHLHKLETLKCTYDWIGGLSELELFRFPSNLRKLNLRSSSFVISQTFLTTLCTLPNLEVLKIQKCNFTKDTETEDDKKGVWEAEDEDVFRSLRFLLLENLDLMRWTADETNFPQLRHLVIRNCSKLEEIPCGIGEIATLQLIELEKCKASVVDSAKRIQEEQQSEYGNYGLKLQIS